MRAIDGDALRDRLQNLAYDDWNQGATTTWAEAFNECADMVADAPTIEPEPCEDTISRKAAIDAVKHAWAKGLEPTQYIENLPSAQTSSTHKALDTISRQAAIEVINIYFNKTDVPARYPGIITALEEWLNNLPSAQPQHDISKANFLCPICGAEMEFAVSEWEGEG